MLRSRKALMVSGAVAALVRPKLAQDARVDLAGLFGNITAKNLKSQRTKLAKAVVSTVSPHLAQDEGIDVDDVCKVIDALQGGEVAEDEDDEIPDAAEEDVAEDEGGEGEKVAALLNYLKGRLSDEDYAEASRMVEAEEAADEAPDDEGGKKDDEERMSKPAMDAMLRKTREDARRETLAEMNAIRTAERVVFPLVGELTAMDSASAIYRLALDSAGYPESALKGAPVATLKAMAEREVASRAGKPKVALDSAAMQQANDSFAELYGSN